MLFFFASGCIINVVCGVVYISIVIDQYQQSHKHHAACCVCSFHFTYEWLVQPCRRPVETWCWCDVVQELWEHAQAVLNRCNIRGCASSNYSDNGCALHIGEELELAGGWRILHVMF